MITSAQTLHSSLQGPITNRKRTWQHWSATLLLFVLNEWKKERLIVVIWMRFGCVSCLLKKYLHYDRSYHSTCVFKVLLSSIQKVVLKSPWNWIEIFFMEHCCYYDLLVRAHHYFIKFMCPYFLIKITFTTFCSNIF